MTDVPPVTDETQVQAQNIVSAFLTNRPITAHALNLALTAVIAYAASQGTIQVGGDLTGRLPNPTIAPGAVTGAKIAPGTITAGLLAPGVGGGSGGGGSGYSGVIPARVVAGTAAAQIVPGDGLVCLNGPVEADLEPSPLVGATHVVLDCRASPQPTIHVVASGGATINGGGALGYSMAGQAATFTFTALGWRIH